MKQLLGTFNALTGLTLLVIIAAALAFILTFSNQSTQNTLDTADNALANSAPVVYNKKITDKIINFKTLPSDARSKVYAEVAKDYAACKDQTTAGVEKYVANAFIDLRSGCGGQGQTLLAKQNGQWLVVKTSNKPLGCEAAATYRISKELSSSCVDKNGSVIANQNP